MQEPTNPTPWPEPTQVGTPPFPSIPGYRFQKRLGKGGMATVYLATQESLDRPVSIKVMAREALQDETSKQRFENEARTIAKLSHVGIVGIHEVGRTSDGQMYYVMPYLSNGDLSQRDLRNDEAQITEVLRMLLSALGYAHSHGIVHRDVKEENVLFDAHNRPLLTDFGIARSKTDTSRLTMAGLSVGSSGFMAPEQARGEEVDGRADLYSVGVLTFALLTGHLPFRATDPLALALMHSQEPVPKLPPEKRHWQAFVDRAMAKQPAQRFANADQMRQALDRISEHANNSLFGRAKHNFERVVERSGGKNRFLMVIAAAILLLATALYAVNAWFMTPSAPVAVAAPPPAIAAPAKPVPPPEPVAANEVAPTEIAPATASTTSTSTYAETKPTTPPAKSATPSTTKPATTTSPPPSPPPPARHQPVRKIKGWFSRLFHHR